jgi:hypothetical protein
LLRDKWVIKEIREEIKKFLKFNENESKTYQTCETSKGGAKVKF